MKGMALPGAGFGAGKDYELLHSGDSEREWWAEPSWHPYPRHRYWEKAEIPVCAGSPACREVPLHCCRVPTKLWCNSEVVLRAVEH